MHYFSELTNNYAHEFLTNKLKNFPFFIPMLLCIDLRNTYSPIVLIEHKLFDIISTNLYLLHRSNESNDYKNKLTIYDNSKNWLLMNECAARAL